MTSPSLRSAAPPSLGGPGTTPTATTTPTTLAMAMTRPDTATYNTIPLSGAALDADELRRQRRQAMEANQKLQRIANRLTGNVNAPEALTAWAEVLEVLFCPPRGTSVDGRRMQRERWEG